MIKIIEIQNKNALNILNWLHTNGFEAYFVGGCVRDLLMNKIPSDYDITTNATPEQVLALNDNAFRCIPTGLQHGTVTVVHNSERVEVTTYRHDGEYQDHRRPTSVLYSKRLEDDLKRRDFTINAICFDNINLYDLFDGIQDIQNKQIRSIGNPHKRFQEDALRILRALRFSCQLSFTIDPTTLLAMQDLANTLSYISKERIRDELIKMIQTTQNNLLTLLKEYAVLPYIVPQLMDTIGVKQQNPYHIYDVFEHINQAFNASISYPVSTRLAILLHDIEKPHYKSTDEAGIDHFYGHAQAGAETAKAILHDLHFPNHMIALVSTSILYHDYHLTTNKKSIRKFMYKLQGNFDLAYQILDVQMLDNSAKNPILAMSLNNTIQEVKTILKQMQQDNETFTMKQLRVDGNDMIALGYQGKQVGDILQLLLLHVLNHQKENTYARLMELAERKQHEIFNR